MRKPWSFCFSNLPKMKKYDNMHEASLKLGITDSKKRIYNVIREVIGDIDG